MPCDAAGRGLAIGFGPRPRGMFVPTAAVLGTAAVYLVYVTTPRDARLAPATSFSQLVTHLLPAAFHWASLRCGPLTSGGRAGAASAVTAG